MSEKESPSAIFARLIIEADAGPQSKVSEADALEFRRDQYGLTAQRWAMVLGLTPAHYSEIASGKRRLPVNSIARAVAVAVPVEPLLAGRTEAWAEKRAKS
jgi:transcriptional regulator with XRE-family HTH domain